MYRIHCLNNISKYGTDLLTSSYELTDDMSQAAGVLVRSAAMHDMEFPADLLAIARAGPVTTTSRSSAAPKRASSSSTPPVPTPRR